MSSCYKRREQVQVVWHSGVRQMSLSLHWIDNQDGSLTHWVNSSQLFLLTNLLNSRIVSTTQLIHKKEGITCNIGYQATTWTKDKCDGLIFTGSCQGHWRISWTWFKSHHMMNTCNKKRWFAWKKTRTGDMPAGYTPTVQATTNMNLPFSQYDNSSVRGAKVENK